MFIQVRSRTNTRDDDDFNIAVNDISYFFRDSFGYTRIVLKTEGVTIETKNTIGQIRNKISDKLLNQKPEPSL